MNILNKGYKMKFIVWTMLVVGLLIWLGQTSNGSAPRPQLTAEQCKLEAVEIAGRVYTNQMSGKQDYFDSVDLQAYNDKGCKKSTLDVAIKSMY